MGFLRALVFILALAGVIAPGMAAEVTLLQGGRSGDSYLLGLHVKLQPGWMTYARDPGEAGIAPKIVTDGSQNLKSAIMDFPPHKTFKEGSFTVYGYDGEVVFPLKAVAEDARKPVFLKLDFSYAVCEKICVPKKAQFAVELSEKPEPAALRMLRK